jgi:uncharacterized membrane-anchored protein
MGDNNPTGFGARALKTQAAEDLSTLTKVPITMTGVSAVLLAADVNRKLVIVASTAANSAAAIDPTGATCALDSGLPLPGGGAIRISGKAAQSAMTQIGTNGQKLTVYTG